MDCYAETIPSLIWCSSELHVLVENLIFPFFFVRGVEPSGDFKPFAPARASLVIKRSMSHPDCSGMLEKELGDPYVPPRMPQLSGLFRSHPNQCVSLEPAASGEQVHKSPPSYLLGSAAGSCRDLSAPQM